LIRRKTKGEDMKKGVHGEQHGSSDMGKPETYTEEQLSRLYDVLYYTEKAGGDEKKVFSVFPDAMKGEFNYSNWRYVEEGKTLPKEEKVSSIVDDILFLSFIEKKAGVAGVNSKEINKLFMDYIKNNVFQSGNKKVPYLELDSKTKEKVWSEFWDSIADQYTSLEKEIDNYINKFVLKNRASKKRCKTRKNSKTENEFKIRETLISKIEGVAGELLTVPWEKVSTEDLEKILAALRYRRSSLKKKMSSKIKEFYYNDIELKKDDIVLNYHIDGKSLFLGKKRDSGKVKIAEFDLSVLEDDQKYSVKKLLAPVDSKFESILEDFYNYFELFGNKEEDEKNLKIALEDIESDIELIDKVIILSNIEFYTDGIESADVLLKLNDNEGLEITDIISDKQKSEFIEFGDEELIRKKESRW